MPAPDPEGMSLLEKVVVAAAPVVGAIWGARSWLERRFAKKADKTEVSKEFTEVKAELQHQRGVQGKIFDQMRDIETASEKRHRELLMHLVRKGE